MAIKCHVNEVMEVGTWTFEKEKGLRWRVGNKREGREVSQGGHGQEKKERDKVCFSEIGE